MSSRPLARLWSELLRLMKLSTFVAFRTFSSCASPITTTSPSSQSSGSPPVLISESESVSALSCSSLSCLVSAALVPM